MVPSGPQEKPGVPLSLAFGDGGDPTTEPDQALLRGRETTVFSCLDMCKPGDLEGTGGRLGGLWVRERRLLPAGYPSAG